jgi:hypothetical protein
MLVNPFFESHSYLDTQNNEVIFLGPSDPTSFDDIVIEIANMTIQNVETG